MSGLVESLLLGLVFPGIGAGLVTILFMIWFERKFTARVQRRIGPLYVSKRLHGVLQLLADGLRFLFQEPIVPVSVDKAGFLAAPILAVVLAAAALLFLPAAPGLAAIPTRYNTLAFLALMAVTPLPIIIAGWASDNKFSLIGALREAFLNVSYEPVIFVSILAMIILYGTVDATRMVEAQAAVPGVIANPLAAFTYLVAVMAATDRPPFDIVFGEQEIVSGPYTEYSGILFGYTMMRDYLNLYAFSIFFTLVFLGGWLPARSLPLAPLIVYVKSVAVMALLVTFRSIYCRLRLDHALRLLWHLILPLGLAALALSASLTILHGGWLPHA